MCIDDSRLTRPTPGRRAPAATSGALLLALLVGLWGRDALAACAGPKPGFPAATGLGVGSAPASDTFINPTAGKSYSYFTQGKTLYAVRNIVEDGQLAGTTAWTWTDVSTLSNFPSPVTLSVDAGVNKNEYIFITSQSGYLFKINAANGMVAGSVDTRRIACPGDQVVATPSVQMFRFSNAAWKEEMNSHLGKTNVDVVIVPTRTMCGDSTHNRVIGYYSDTLTQKWAFNASFARKVDYISEGGPIDYDNNRYYFGTNLGVAVLQNSLFAISTIDGADGLGGTAPVWSGNAGSIQNRPQLANGRLYVATVSGSIQAFDPAGDGGGNTSPLWGVPAQMPGLVSRNIWYESRAGLFQGNFLVLDSLGNLRAYHDAGDAAAVLWTQVANGGSVFTSMPAVFPAQNTAYIGKADGKLLQINLEHGAYGDQANVTGVAATVGDPTVDAIAGGAIDTVVASASGVLTSFAVPWASTPCNGGGVLCMCAGNPPYPPSCASALCNALIGNPCMTVDCVGVNGATGQGKCASIGTYAPNGTVCDDGVSCTCDCKNADINGVCKQGANLDSCQAGKCQGAPVCYGGCSCVNQGDLACAGGNPSSPNKACCGQANGGCVDLMTDPHNCATCGVDCGSGTCVDGTCRAIAQCSFVNSDQLNQVSGMLVGGDAIAFDNASLGKGGTCTAYMSSYIGGQSTSPFYQISPKAVVLKIDNGNKADLAPLNGVAVSLQGDWIFGSLVNDINNKILPEMAIVTSKEQVYNRAAQIPGPKGTVGKVGEPFAEQSFNTGPVGPVFDVYAYNGMLSKRNTYWANFSKDGDLLSSSFVDGKDWRANAVLDGANPITFPARVYAMALGNRERKKHLAVAYGTTIQFVNLDAQNRTNRCNGKLVNDTLDCVDLGLWDPPKNDKEGKPAKILSLATHPVSGEIYALVEDANVPVNVYVLNIDPVDLSPRLQADVCDDQHLPPKAFPVVLGQTTAAEGKISITPDLNLLYLIPTVNKKPSFTAYPVTRK